MAGFNAAQCTPWTLCTAGYQITILGTSSSDRFCRPCPNDTYQDVPNSPTCIIVRVCTAGFFVVRNNSRETDTVCAPCAVGLTYSSGSNWNACLNLTVCAEAVAPDLSTDRVCAASVTTGASGMGLVVAAAAAAVAGIAVLVVVLVIMLFRRRRNVKRKVDAALRLSSNGSTSGAIEGPPTAHKHTEYQNADDGKSPAYSDYGHISEPQGGADESKDPVYTFGFADVNGYSGVDCDE
jgi:TNFR/NGFR cysteine-rich region